MKNYPFLWEKLKKERFWIETFSKQLLVINYELRLMVLWAASKWLDRAEGSAKNESAH